MTTNTTQLTDNEILEGFRNANERIVKDYYCHTAVLVYYQKIKYSFHNSCVF